MKLEPYQQYCKEFIKKTPYCALFLDMGLGKTLITLKALEEMALNAPILVIAPVNIAKFTWIEEIKKFNIQLPHESLIINDKGRKLSKKKRIERYQSVDPNQPKIYFINRELTQDIVEFFYPNFPFKTVVIDEVQSFKNHASVRFKALKKVRPQIEHLIGLTGTPTPNGLIDLWAQIYLLDQGKRLGPNISTYRNTFFNIQIVMNNIPVKWTPKKGAEEFIYKCIDDITISIDNPNIQLPDCKKVNHIVEMTSKERKQYDAMVKDKILYVDGIENPVTAENAGVLAGRLSQMASGSLYINEEKEFEIIHENKLDMLEYIIENTSRGKLIAYHFKSDLAMIENRLKKNKMPYEVFDGKDDQVERWNKGLIENMLIQPAKAGHGLNLQYGGHALIWYTLPWSLEMYMQTNKRLHRRGQKDTVIIHHILTKDTIDHRILSLLENKKTDQEHLIDAVKHTIK